MAAGRNLIDGALPVVQRRDVRISRRLLVSQDINRYERVLERMTDVKLRARVETLLAEARSELTVLQRIWSWTCPHLAVPDAIGFTAETLLDKIVAAHKSDFGSLQLWDETTQSLRLIAHFNFDRASARQFASVKDGDGTVCEAAQSSRAPVYVEDVGQTERFASLRSWCATLGIRAVQTTPIFDSNDRFVGAFSTHHTSEQSFAGAVQELNSVYARTLGRLFADLRPA